MTAVCAPRLLIWIPSYNRIDSLTQLLQRFRDIGVPAWAQIVVSDNASFPEYPLDKLRQACVGLEFSYIKNVCNIGACPNILRAFEFASDAPWLLVHSDDDLPSDDFFEILDKSIQESAENVVAIKYDSCIFGSQRNLALSQIDQYPLSGGYAAERFFFNLSFISNWLFNASAMRRVLGIGYAAIASYVPHISLVSASLAGHDAVIRFSKDIPVIPSLVPHAWNEAVVMSSMFIWFRYFPSPSLFSHQARRMYADSLLGSWKRVARLGLVINQSTILASNRAYINLALVLASLKYLLVSIALAPMLILMPSSLKMRLLARLSISDGGMDRL